MSQRGVFRSHVLDSIHHRLLACGLARIGGRLRLEWHEEGPEGRHHVVSYREPGFHLGFVAHLAAIAGAVSLSQGQGSFPSPIG